MALQDSARVTSAKHRKGNECGILVSGEDLVIYEEGRWEERMDLCHNMTSDRVLRSRDGKVKWKKKKQGRKIG